MWLLKRFTESYLYPSCCQVSWKNGPRQTDFQGKNFRLSRKNCIQQDGAKSHICEDKNEFNDTLTEQDINAELYAQVANSPDVKSLDFGIFQAIQSFNDAMWKNTEELIQAVSTAYDNYP